MADEIVTVHPVDSNNWREVAALQVTEAQRAFVAEPSYYLALCAYGDTWHPLAVYLGDEVIGFLMWGIDPADSACWLGGILVDARQQGKGYGRSAVQAAIAQLQQAHGYQHFALSYQPENTVARHLYQSLGFVESDEWEDDEVVARLALDREQLHYVVRLLQLDDHAEWLRLREALWPDQSDEQNAQEMTEIRGHIDTMPVFVAERAAGGLCGLMEVTIHQEAPGCSTNQIGYLEAWYVDPDMRRQGVGRALVEAAEAWAIDQGCTEMASDTMQDYPISPAAHTQLGYQEVGRDIYFRKKLI